MVNISGLLIMNHLSNYEEIDQLENSFSLCAIVSHQDI